MLGYHYFRSRQIAAMEKRLRDGIRSITIRPDESDEGAESIHRRIDETNRRIDDTNAEIRILINDVGVVKGALGVSTQSRESEPVRTE